MLGIQQQKNPTVITIILLRTHCLRNTMPRGTSLSMSRDILQISRGIRFRIKISRHIRFRIKISRGIRFRVQIPRHTFTNHPSRRYVPGTTGGIVVNPGVFLSAVGEQTPVTAAGGVAFAVVVDGEGEVV